MSRPNLARLEPSAYQVLAVADPVKVADTTEQVLGELDLDHLCRLLVRSERSLSLVNRRSFAAALADVPVTANKALRPAPPFHEAVAIAREDGKVLERTRSFLSQNPRALEELTPELTLALLRHFDPTMRMRPTNFTRNFVAVGSVTMIALVAAVLGYVHTQENAELLNNPTVRRPVQVARPVTAPVAPVVENRRLEEPPLESSVPPANVSHGAVRIAPPVRASESAANTADSNPPVVSNAVPNPVSVQPAAPVHVWHRPASTENGSLTSLFVPAAAVKAPVASPAAAVTTPSAQAQPTTAAQTTTASAGTTAAGTTTTTNGPNAVTPQTNADATAMVLRTTVSRNPSAKVDWIRAKKASDNIVTVTTQVRNGEAVSQETYRLWNSNGQFTVIDHKSSTP